jgi:carbonic anhydrase
MRQKLAVVALFFFAATSYATSRDFWHELMLGNERYVAGSVHYDHLKEERKANLTSQHPPVTVLSCADSRVPPELIFAHSVGEIFVVRVAGNVADKFPMASLEYAVYKGWTKLIVVMGHEDCGAVNGAWTNAHLPSDDLMALLAHIRVNFGGHTPPTLKDATQLNARASAKELLKSKIISDAVKAGTLKIVPAYYSFDGKVVALPE